MVSPSNTDKLADVLKSAHATIRAEVESFCTDYKKLPPESRKERIALALLGCAILSTTDKKLGCELVAKVAAVTGIKKDPIECAIACWLQVNEGNPDAANAELKAFEDVAERWL